MKKVGIFLTGGGAKGAFEIGFLKALEELGIKPNVICGSSSGAIIGAGATYLNSYELLDKWMNISLEKPFHIDSKKINETNTKKRTLQLWKELFLSCSRRKSLISLEEIRDILYSSLEEEKIRYSSIDFGLTTTKLPTLSLQKLFKEEIEEGKLLESILASMYLPIFKRERILDNSYYMDIAALRRIPLDMLKNKNCNEIYIVHVGLNDIERTIKNAQKTFLEEEVYIINMKDKTSLLDFSKEQTIYNYNYGYLETMKTLSKRKNR